MNARDLKVVMLCGNGRSSRIMYYGLADHVNIISVIVEDKSRRVDMVKRRVKRLGLLRVGGQLLFKLFNTVVSKASEARGSQLICDFNLDDSLIPGEKIIKVDSVNSEETIRLLKELKPRAVVVNGTRIISKKVLSSIRAPFVNTHMGITPRYRGVHGGYWALAMADPENCGVTIHLVDEGIDTGGVLYQDRIWPTDEDSFNTYPIHQIAKAIPLMRAALVDVRENRIAVKTGVTPSRLWYHPTLFEYWMYWKSRGVT